MYPKRVTPTGNAAEPALPGRWRCPLEGVTREARRGGGHFDHQVSIAQASPAA